MVNTNLNIQFLSLVNDPGCCTNFLMPCNFFFKLRRSKQDKHYSSMGQDSKYDLAVLSTQGLTSRCWSVYFSAFFHYNETPEIFNFQRKKVYLDHSSKIRETHFFGPVVLVPNGNGREQKAEQGAHFISRSNDLQGPTPNNLMTSHQASPPKYSTTS